MRTNIKILLIILLLLTNGCQGKMTGIVIDAETRQPVEGAVVLVEWTKTAGMPGLSHTESYKVVEVLTDKDGKFTAPGVWNPIVHEPDLTVYKSGYVAWNNKFIFPDYRNRQLFEWKDGFVFELERFKDQYGYIKHSSFIDGAARLYSQSGEKQVFINLFHEAEKAKELAELNEKNKGDK